MVIIRLNGGLGNQMFQYAAGRAAALRNQTSLALNTTFFDETHGKEAHEKELQFEIFPAIKAQCLPRVSSNELFQIEDESRGVIRRNYNKILNKFGLPESFKIVSESQLLQYQSDFKRHRASVLYMASDWQNEKYFIDYKDIIKKDFTFPTLASNKNINLLLHIQNTNSISVHIRRGDYLSSSVHLPLSINYYKEAIALIRKNIDKPLFFVFSDDIEWCKNELLLQEAEYVNHNFGEQSYIDMQLMSNCKHNIIANSSFSWWGAWLNQNKNKIVISPKMWLEKINIKSENIVPDSYVKL